MNRQQERIIGYVLICIALIMAYQLMREDQATTQEGMANVGSLPKPTHLEPMVVPAYQGPTVAGVEIPTTVEGVKEFPRQLVDALRQEQQEPEAHVAGQNLATPEGTPVSSEIPKGTPSPRVDLTTHLGFDERLSVPHQAEKIKMDVTLEKKPELETATSNNHLQQVERGVCEQVSNPGFLNEFTHFREMTNQNSSQRMDLVDRVTELYLIDNQEDARGHPDRKISDLFNHLTLGEDLKCVRPGVMDGLLPRSCYRQEGFRGETYTPDTWAYDGEKGNNGGLVDPDRHIYAHDLSYEPSQAL